MIYHVIYTVPEADDGPTRCEHNHRTVTGAADCLYRKTPEAHPGLAFAMAREDGAPLQHGESDAIAHALLKRYAYRVRFDWGLDPEAFVAKFDLVFGWLENITTAGMWGEIADVRSDEYSKLCAWQEQSLEYRRSESARLETAITERRQL